MSLLRWLPVSGVGTVLGQCCWPDHHPNIHLLWRACSSPWRACTSLLRCNGASAAVLVGSAGARPGGYMFPRHHQHPNRLAWLA